MTYTSLEQLGDSSSWANLRMVMLTATFEAAEDCQLPEYKGSTLRGAFGHSLVALSGHSADGKCAMCERGRCGYGCIFEGQSAGHGRNLVLPLIIEPPLETRQHYLEGEQFTMKVTLVGDALSWVPTVVWSLGRMGWKGLGTGKSPWSLIEVEAQTPEGKAISLLDNFEAVPVVSGLDILRALPSFDACELQFQTPLCIRRNREMLREIDAVTLIQRINGRLGDLQEAFCGLTIDRIEMSTLNEAAEQICVDSAEFKLANWERFSSRSNQRHTVEGITGTMQLSNIPAMLTPLIVLGQFLHIGKSAAFGMGCYKVIPR